MSFESIETNVDDPGLEESVSDEDDTGASTSEREADVVSDPFAGDPEPEPEPSRDDDDDDDRDREPQRERDLARRARRTERRQREERRKRDDTSQPGGVGAGTDEQESKIATTGPGVPGTNDPPTTPPPEETTGGNGSNDDGTGGTDGPQVTVETDGPSGEVSIDIGERQPDADTKKAVLKAVGPALGAGESPFIIRAVDGKPTVVSEQFDVSFQDGEAVVSSQLIEQEQQEQLQQAARERAAETLGLASSEVQQVGAGGGGGGDGSFVFGPTEGALGKARENLETKQEFGAIEPTEADLGFRFEQTEQDIAERQERFELEERDLETRFMRTEEQQERQEELREQSLTEADRLRGIEQQNFRERVEARGGGGELEEGEQLVDRFRLGLEFDVRQEESLSQTQQQQEAADRELLGVDIPSESTDVTTPFGLFGGITTSDVTQRLDPLSKRFQTSVSELSDEPEEFKRTLGIEDEPFPIPLSSDPRDIQGAFSALDPFALGQEGIALAETGEFLLFGEGEFEDRAGQVGSQGLFLAGEFADFASENPRKAQAGLFGGAAVGTALSPIRVSRLKVPRTDAPDVTVRGAQLSTPPAAKLVGVDRQTRTLLGARGKRPTIGAPEVDLTKVDFEELPGQSVTFERGGEFETEVFDKSRRQLDEQSRRRDITAEQMREFGERRAPRRTRTIETPTEEIVGSARATPSPVVSEISELLEEIDGTIKGSAATSAQLERARQPRDIDLITKDPDELLAQTDEILTGQNAQARDIFDTARRAESPAPGETLKFGIETPARFETPGGVEVISASEQLIRKAGASAFFRGEGVGDPARVDIGPEPTLSGRLRFKDPADTAAMARQLLVEDIADLPPTIFDPVTEPAFRFGGRVRQQATTGLDEFESVIGRSEALIDRPIRTSTGAVSAGASRVATTMEPVFAAGERAGFRAGRAAGRGVAQTESLLPTAGAERVGFGAGVIAGLEAAEEGVDRVVSGAATGVLRVDAELEPLVRPFEQTAFEVGFLAGSAERGVSDFSLPSAGLGGVGPGVSVNPLVVARRRRFRREAEQIREFEEAFEMDIEQATAGRPDELGIRDPGELLAEQPLGGFDFDLDLDRAERAQLNLVPDIDRTRPDTDVDQTPQTQIEQPGGAGVEDLGLLDESPVTGGREATGTAPLFADPIIGSQGAVARGSDIDIDGKGGGLVRDSDIDRSVSSRSVERRGVEESNVLSRLRSRIDRDTDVLSGVTVGGVEESGAIGMRGESDRSGGITGNVGRRETTGIVGSPGVGQDDGGESIVPGGFDSPEFTSPPVIDIPGIPGSPPPPPSREPGGGPGGGRTPGGDTPPPPGEGLSSVRFLRPDADRSRQPRQRFSLGFQERQRIAPAESLAGFLGFEFGGEEDFGFVGPVTGVEPTGELFVESRGDKRKDEEEFGFDAMFDTDFDIL